jgi:hypothetical protein
MRRLDPYGKQTVDAAHVGLGTDMRLHRFIAAPIAAAAILLAVVHSAAARLLIEIDKSAQRMVVTRDGERLHVWPVSTGLRNYATPSGQFTPFRMERDHFSREWDDAPMPHSIFFTRDGHAIHGTTHLRQIGRPASHGCVRLEPENARELFEMVRREGMVNTRIVLLGDTPDPRSPVLARPPRYDERLPYGERAPRYDERPPYGGRAPGYDERPRYGNRPDIVERPRYEPQPRPQPPRYEPQQPRPEAKPRYEPQQPRYEAQPSDPPQWPEVGAAPSTEPPPSQEPRQYEQRPGFEPRSGNPPRPAERPRSEQPPVTTERVRPSPVPRPVAPPRIEERPRGEPRYEDRPRYGGDPRFEERPYPGQRPGYGEPREEDANEPPPGSARVYRAEPRSGYWVQRPDGRREFIDRERELPPRQPGRPYGGN